MLVWVHEGVNLLFCRIQQKDKDLQVKQVDLQVATVAFE
jgi:hypothetical protein